MTARPDITELRERRSRLWARAETRPDDERAWSALEWTERQLFAALAELSAENARLRAALRGRGRTR